MPKKNFYYLNVISIIAFFTAFNSNSVLLKVETIKTNNGKKVTIFSDQHTPHSENQKQLNNFVDVLKKYKNQEKEIYILIERPAKTPINQSKNPSILSNLKNDLSKSEKITIENVENRCLSTAAISILSARNPHNINPKTTLKAGKKTCCLGNITFKSILEEFYEIVRKLNKYFGKQNPKIKQIKEKSIKRANSDLNNFTKKLSNNNISLSENILQFTQNLFDKQDTNSHKILSHNILHIFAPLFNLNVIKKIFSTSKKRIALITGHQHAVEIKSDLLKLNGSLIYSSEQFDINKPISKKQIEESLYAKKETKKLTKKNVSIFGLGIIGLNYLIYKKYFSDTKNNAKQKNI